MGPAQRHEKKQVLVKNTTAKDSSNSSSEKASDKKAIAKTDSNQSSTTNKLSDVSKKEALGNSTTTKEVPDQGVSTKIDSIQDAGTKEVSDKNTGMRRSSSQSSKELSGANLKEASDENTISEEISKLDIGAEKVSASSPPPPPPARYMVFPIEVQLIILDLLSPTDQITIKMSKTPLFSDDLINYKEFMFFNIAGDEHLAENFPDGLKTKSLFNVLDVKSTSECIRLFTEAQDLIQRNSKKYNIFKVDSTLFPEFYLQFMIHSILDATVRTGSFQIIFRHPLHFNQKYPETSQILFNKPATSSDNYDKQLKLGSLIKSKIENGCKISVYLPNIETIQLTHKFEPSVYIYAPKLMAMCIREVPSVNITERDVVMKNVSKSNIDRGGEVPCVYLPYNRL
ncbi:hypothetical protein BN7_4396 [Wickerhamomyces ciferrii]|uniref:Uncharacterized protein n=1 Tax=Wickerhamomyces ciferrii (strain ATCC 14091 / BCRC 22168 / CBS 111 / JCM 3599 / NBRC 0793 / NRRL Y-1031 F-60-10) TaxID=1206466 RepID=K0KS61_WICCF|nr:uncharacterized protein BN7_4396 [Wickerhamomyces ciferrii]CCH44827.1 hypothetical protein BN7_4396 [Wickerhamomyces ciferrii]